MTKVEKVPGLVQEPGAQILQFRSDVRDEFSAVRKEMTEEFATVRQEMHEEFVAVRQEMREGDAAVRQEMRDGFAMVDTKLQDLGSQMRVLHEEVIARAVFSDTCGNLIQLYQPAS